MSAAQELLTQQHAETKSTLAIAESQLRDTREELEHCVALLASRESELARTRDDLTCRTQELDVSKRQLRATQIALQEEEVVRSAHQNTEGTLNEVATGLRSTVHHLTDDVEGLNAKLSASIALVFALLTIVARRTEVFEANRAAVAQLGSALSSETDASRALLNEFTDSHKKLLAQAKADLEQFLGKNTEVIALPVCIRAVHSTL